jgi:hypothetical protein
LAQLNPYSAAQLLANFGLNRSAQETRRQSTEKNKPNRTLALKMMTSRKTTSEKQPK